MSIRLIFKKHNNMQKHLILAGAGHAHLTILSNLKTFIDNGTRVTIVSPADYHYYSGMGPGMLSGMYRPREVRFNIKKLVESSGANFLLDKVTRVSPDKHALVLSNGNEIFYDIVSFNTGSEVFLDFSIEDSENVYMVKPIENLLYVRNKILDLIKEKDLRIVVIGGGAAGVEIAGNLKRLADQSQGSVQIILMSSGKLLPRFHDRIRRLALHSLQSRNIEIYENSTVLSIINNYINLSESKRMQFDIAIISTGIKPSSIFKNSEIPAGADGGLLVNEYLQSVKYPDIFGGGDCIYFHPKSLDKVGVYAVRQNKILFNNIHAALGRGTLKAFYPQNKYISILNMGDGGGIFFRNSFACYGRKAFVFKNYLDKSFMKKFQLSGEMKESAD